MARKYFGTDGVRGRVGEPPITPDFVMRLGYAAGVVLLRRSKLRKGERAAVLIGKDTRISGYMLEAALEASRRERTHTHFHPFSHAVAHERTFAHAVSGVEED